MPRLCLLCCLLLFGCGEAPVVPPPEEPSGEPPDVAVNAALQALVAGEPAQFWRQGLPASYRADLDALREETAKALDPQVHGACVALLRELGVLLLEQRAFLLNSAYLAPAHPDAAAESWPALAALPRVVAEGPLGRLPELRERSLGSLLQEEGRAWSAAYGASDPLGRLQAMRATLLRQAGDEALLRLQFAGGDSQQTRFRRVEGVWVPAAMAREWPATMAQVRARRDAWLRRLGRAHKADTVAFLQALQDNVRAMQAATSQEDFDIAAARALSAYNSYRLLLQ